MNIVQLKALDGPQAWPRRTQTPRDADVPAEKGIRSWTRLICTNTEQAQLAQVCFWLHSSMGLSLGLASSAIREPETCCLFNIDLYFLVCSTLCWEELQLPTFNVREVTSCSVISLASPGTWSMTLIGSKLCCVRQPHKQGGKNRSIKVAVNLLRLNAN